MKAYTATITKTEFVRELKKHQKADDFVRGTYWDGSKGCAVGCSLKSINTVKKLGITDFANHKLYETHLGIPEWLARVEDALFEGMTLERSKSWPVEFASAIRPKANLEAARVPFIVMLLEHTLVSMDQAKFDAMKWPQVADAIKGSMAAVRQMIEAQKSGDKKAVEEATSAASSAARSARSAESTAESESAESAARSAAWSAESAARLEAWSESAARLATSAAWSAAWSAESAARLEAWSESAARLATSAARSAAYDYYATQLIIILKECK